jgi:hypothetical protein
VGCPCCTEEGNPHALRLPRKPRSRRRKPDDAADAGTDQLEDDRPDDDAGSRRVRSTRRLEGMPELPQQTVADRTVGTVFHRPGRQGVPAVDDRHPELGPNRRIQPGKGVPARPERYDYRRAALDALHYPTLMDRWFCNLRPRWAVGKRGDDRLFHAPECGPLSESNWKRSVGWSRACASIGRPRLRPHDLRHTCASIWLGAGGRSQGGSEGPGARIGCDDDGPVRAPHRPEPPGGRGSDRGHDGGT